MQVLHALTDPGDRIVMAYPTFDGYPICAQMARLQTVMVPLDHDGRHDLEAMADAAAERVSCALPTSQPERHCRAHRRSPPLSAAGAPRHARAAGRGLYRIRLVKPTDKRARSGSAVPNVIVVRTFSKAYGLAGMRTGYAFC